MPPSLSDLQKNNSEILSLAREVKAGKTRSYVAAAGILAGYVLDHLGDMAFVPDDQLQSKCQACGAKFGDHIIARDVPGAQCPPSIPPVIA